MLFSPAQFVTVELVEGAQQRPQDPEMVSDIKLDAPLFFENTHYQFEWVFLKDVDAASLSHRSQSLNEAFRFVEKRGPSPARLTGTINTGNDVGWMRLPISFEVNGSTHHQHIAFEVLPTKMLLSQDLPAMYQAIDSIYPLWRFSLVEKTEQSSKKGKQRGHFPLMWLANFEQLRNQFEKGLKVISAGPHRRLQPSVTHLKAAKLKGRLSYKLAERVKQDIASQQVDQRYRVETKKLSINTPENRFIKMIVTQSKRQLAEFEQRLRTSNNAPDRQRLSDEFLNELHSWQKPLQKVLNQSFLKDVGSFAGVNGESLVLQQKTGYSAVYRVWQELKFYLDVFDGQANISMKSVAEIYEVWCFIQLKKILELDLGFGEPKQRKPKLTEGVLGELDLVNGDRGAFEFYRKEDGVRAKLYHEKAYGRNTQAVRTFLLTHRPDIVLEVTLPDGKEFVWLFDAKYRIESLKVGLTGDFSGKPRPQESDIWERTCAEERQSLNFRIEDGVPDDAINQMHRYRDALIRITDKQPSVAGHKSRPVFGAFALYPGYFNQEAVSNPYSEAIREIGIGAFALLPSSDGKVSDHWLSEFLREQIGDQSAAYSAMERKELLYVQEAARISYHGMQQVLYPDLTMTIALGGKKGRINAYFDAFEQGIAQWYHMPKKTFSTKFKQHVVDEIRYLALGTTSENDSKTKQIDKLWPVKSVAVMPRNTINEQQSGRKSASSELYYLFELGRPLTLQRSVTKMPHRPIQNTMKLATLNKLENAQEFSGVEQVYKGALA
ncbi:MAG TPA: DUF2357 domain-containing protein [Thiopseudomonas sp.]|nr:DUF2357 domain-containing protein [Thiopseudomonas sp.]